MYPDIIISSRFICTRRTIRKFNWKINKLSKPRTSVRNRHKNATRLKEMPRVCQPPWERSCSSMYRTQVPADPWCHKKCTVHHETNYHKHSALSSYGSVGGHLFLMQRTQTRAGTWKWKEEGNQVRHWPRQGFHQPMWPPVPQDFIAQAPGPLAQN